MIDVIKELQQLKKMLQFTIPKLPNKRDNKTTQKCLWMLRVYDEYLQEMATFYGYPEHAKEVVFCKYLRFF